MTTTWLGVRRGCECQKGVSGGWGPIDICVSSSSGRIWKSRRCVRPFHGQTCFVAELELSANPGIVLSASRTSVWVHLFQRESWRSIFCPGCKQRESVSGRRQGSVQTELRRGSTHVSVWSLFAFSHCLGMNFIPPRGSHEARQGVVIVCGGHESGRAAH